MAVLLNSISTTFPASIRFSIKLATLFVLATISANAQTSITDGQTPTGLAPGAPAGAYVLSGFDNINLFNGNLNFRLPLHTVNGRGGAQYTMTLPIEQRWRVQKFAQTFPGSADILTPVGNWWTGIEVGYGPGVLQGRRAGDGIYQAGQLHCQPRVTYYARTLTRLTFTTPDGTEFQLRDQQTGGQPHVVNSCANIAFSRGKVFVTDDGSAATFISDADIIDDLHPAGGDGHIFPSGFLSLRDGTRYRIDLGMVSWMRDRNGNRLSFDYDVFARVTSITDSLNRTIAIQYDVNDVSPYGLCDWIIFKGMGGGERKIRISKTQMANALRSGFSIQTYAQLFPEFNGVSDSWYDPTKIVAVWLPDGQRSYSFFYNSYGELARVELPTSGAIEYDHGNGVIGDPSSGGSGVIIYRRAIERRVYVDGSTLESKTIYSRITNSAGDISITVSSLDAQGVALAYSKHYFHGNPRTSLSPSPTNTAVDYSAWNEGREYQTESYSADGLSLLRRVVNTWQQGCALSQWAIGTGTPNNPRISETVTTLSDANQLTKQIISYDCYNNQTDVYEHGFGAGAPGPLIRRTHTDYVTSNYAADTNIHIRNLPLQQQIFDAGGIKRAETSYEYDNYNSVQFHAPLTDRPNISGHDGAFGAGYIMRGNVTKTSRALLNNSGDVTGWVNSHAQYDTAGNVVKAIDANDNPTLFDFRDNLGSPDDPMVQSAENPVNNAPGELGGQISYAFPFKITNALGHKAYTKYDYYLGRPVLSEGANGVKSNVYFNDALDRVTSGVRAIGTPVASQTIFVYNDSDFPVNGHPARSITTISDKDVFGESNSGVGIKSLMIYDGLGRGAESRRYESASSYITVNTVYDALGRVSQVTNPYRSGESVLWTTTEYDALSRVIKVETPDGAHIDTAYKGNQMLVTDQSQKKRISQTNALGQLTKVWEVTPADAWTVNVSFNGENYTAYQTDYSYDPLNNLRYVNQSGQERWFSYDSFSRLIRVKNPEQAGNPGLAPHTDPFTGGSLWSMAYSYDANGNLVSKIDARNITTTYGYDVLNRATTVNYSDSTPGITRTYDTATLGKGRLQKTETAGSMGSRVTINDYDAMGRPKSQSQQFFHLGAWGTSYTKQQTYDLAGNVMSLRYPSGHTVDYIYDQAGRLSSFSGNLGGSQRDYANMISYNAAGQMIKEQFGTNTLLYHNLHYNNRQQLVSIRVGDNEPDAWNRSRGAFDFFYGTTAVASGDPFANDTDNNGNLRRQINYVPAGGGEVIPQRHDYAYDGMNRLILFTEAQRDSSGQWTLDVARQNFSYDPFGNRKITGAIGSGVSSYNPAYDQPSNRINGLGYDAAGNITSDLATGGTMIYDAESRLLSATSGGGGNYAYNGDGQRVRQLTATEGEIWYVYGCDGKLLAEYATNAQPTAPLKEYGYRGGQLLIIAESGSGGGVSFVKPALKPSADLIAKAGPGLDGDADGLFEIDELVADLEFNEDTGSTTADVSSNNNNGTHIDGVAGTTAEGYGNASSASGVGGALLAEYPPIAAPSPNLPDLDKARGTEPGTPKAMPKEYGRSGWSLATAQSIVVVNPSSYQTPAPGLGGTAVTSPSPMGHGNTGVSASNGSIKTKNCRWSGFQPVSGQIVSITLKVDWGEDGSASGGNSFRLEYSLDNGSSWNTLFNHESINTPNFGTAQVSLPSGQNISLVQVRDQLIAAAPFGGSASVTGSVSSIRLEVETDTTAPVISNVAAGSIAPTSATITWNTNENSDSQVEYRTDTGSWQTTTLNPALVTAHSQGLSGLTPGTLYHYRVKSKDAAGNLATSGAFSFTTLNVNDAAFVSQSVPATMNAGEAYAVTVRMLNQGTTTWTPGQSYRLGSQNPENNGIWGLGRVNLLPGDSVSPGATITFSFVVTAPSNPGSYNFQWRMVQDGVEWFGAMTPNIAVQVVSGPDTTPPTVTSFSPAAEATNVNVNANVTVTFSEAMDAATVNGETVELRDPSTALVAATVSYDPASFTATLNPTAALTAGTIYAVRVRGGGTGPRVKDAAGNALATDKTWTFTTGSGGVKWLVTDHLGSTRMVIGATGNLADIIRHDYAPFGEELSAGVGIRSESNGYGNDSTRQKFTGKERDETTLDYFGARYFSSLAGRFVSVDPILSSGLVTSPQTWNRYSYALNNPLSNVDIYGLYTWGAGVSDEFKATFEGWLADLTTARDTFDKHSKQYIRLNRIITAYGKKGVGGPEIRVAEKSGSGKDFGGSVGAESVWNKDGTVSQNVTFKGSYLAAAAARGEKIFGAGALAHEGQHLADYQDLSASVRITGGNWAWNESLNLTKFGLEDRGHEAEQFAGMALNTNIDRFIPESPTSDIYETFYLYKTSWSRLDSQAQKATLDNARAEYLRRDPLYKLTKDSPGGKILRTK